MRDSTTKEVDGNSGTIESHFFFHYLDFKDPKAARRRIEDLYWNGWRTFVMGFALSGLGITFLALGLGSLLLVGDAPRGFVLLFVGVLLGLPGGYSLMVLWYYVCGNKDYSYYQLLIE